MIKPLWGLLAVHLLLLAGTWLAASATASMAPAAVVRVSEAILKPACDKLSYRSITLPNELKVLLISDPATDKAAAALDVSGRVGVGWMLMHAAAHQQGAWHGCCHTNTLQRTVACVAYAPSTVHTVMLCCFAW